MRDGMTRKVEAGDRDHQFVEWASQWRVTVVVLSGDAAGTEYEMDRQIVSLGRGPESGWGFEDGTMSKEHAALEFAGGGIRLRDLGSMNGMRVNGSDVKVADLKNGDRFQLGAHEFQLVIEERPRQPRTYVVEDE